MKTIKLLSGLLAAGTMTLAGVAAEISNPTPPPPPVTPLVTALTPTNALAWDSAAKSVTAQLGAASAVITFWVTNTSASAVIVQGVQPACGCTVAKLPAQPWRLAPGDGGPIEATLDWRGKSGAITKTLAVATSSGSKTLRFTVTIPDAKGVGAVPLE